MAKKLRYLLKKENLNLNTLVLFSAALPLKTEQDLGSAIFTPGIAGLTLANYVFLDVINKKQW